MSDAAATRRTEAVIQKLADGTTACLTDLLILTVELSFICALLIVLHNAQLTRFKGHADAPSGPSWGAREKCAANGHTE